MASDSQDLILDSESFKEAKITITLIILNIAIFIGTVLLPQDESLIYLFAQININVMNGEIWRLFTCLFIHSNWIHLGGNMVMLLLFGSVVEKTYKWYKYIIIYFVSGLIGNIFSLLLFPPNTISLGASGAIFGLLGASFVLVYFSNERTLLVLAVIYLIYFIK